MLITLKILDKLGACDIAVEKFKAKFPSNRAGVRKVLIWLREINQAGWEGWMMGQTVKLTGAFLNTGADVHKNNDYALNWAAEKGNKEVVELLLQHGAVGNNYTLWLAARNNHKEVVELLKRYM